MESCIERALAAQCAPTLAGLKPGSLFRIGGDPAAMRQTVDLWDQRLSPRGIRVRILKECPAAQACMIYVYRSGWVDQLMEQPAIRAFFHKMGYQPGNTSSLLAQLSRRFCLEQEYPHEIGIFLGYPLEDVLGFMEHRGRNFTCCGLWKCYGDPSTAQARFARYRACTSAYKRMYERGVPVMALVVAA